MYLALFNHGMSFAVCSYVPTFIAKDVPSLTLLYGMRRLLQLTVASALLLCSLGEVGVNSNYSTAYLCHLVISQQSRTNS